jgi:hypothetical protein
MLEFFKYHLNKFREINQKYAEPRARMTRGAGLALVVLRVYLIILMGILLFKFIIVLKG